MSELLPLKEAQRRLLAPIEALPIEHLGIETAHGRYLAEDLRARRTQPAFDHSSMDGFAVSGSGPWALVGESRGGTPFGSVLTSGEAIGISTGAIVPSGADRILIRENAKLDGEKLRAVSEPAQGQHIRRAGFDFEEDATILECGTRLGAAQIALAIAAGHATVPVSRVPVVAILECGDELAADPVFCPPHMIPATNGAMLSVMASQLPCTVRRIGPVADNADALARALAQVQDCDLLVTSGGASVGDHDLIRPALEAWGAQIAFHRVEMKPGKPLMAGQRGEMQILGLPGNPVSSYVTGFLFMLPLLRALSGARECIPKPVSMQSATDLPAVGKRREFLRGTVTEGGARALDEQDSSALFALAQAELLIERPPGDNGVKAGTDVPVYLLQNGGIA